MTAPKTPLASQLAKYGMAPTEWLVLLAHQGRRCPACQRTFTRARPPAVDHDHTTGLVRGLLCLPCNSTLGYLHEDVAWLERAAEYLRTPPAATCFDVRPQDPNAPTRGAT